MSAHEGLAGPKPKRTPIGVIGGMGPLATAAFFAELLRCQRGIKAEQDHAHIIVDSDPSVPDRTAFLLGRGRDPRPSILATAKRLVDAGCGVFTMPCNTAHAFAQDVRAVVGDTFVDWVESGAEMAYRLGAGSVGVLATEGTLHARIYEKALSNHGLSQVLPLSSEVDRLSRVIYQSGKVGLNPVEAQNDLLSIGRRLASDGADVLVLGCSELPLVVDSNDQRWPVPVVDPAIGVAKKALLLAGIPKD